MQETVLAATQFKDKRFLTVEVQYELKKYDILIGNALFNVSTKCTDQPSNRTLIITSEDFNWFQLFTKNKNNFPELEELYKNIDYKKSKHHIPNLPLLRVILDKYYTSMNYRYITTETPILINTDGEEIDHEEIVKDLMMLSANYCCFGSDNLVEKDEFELITISLLKNDLKHHECLIEEHFKHSLSYTTDFYTLKHLLNNNNLKIKY